MRVPTAMARNALGCLPEVSGTLALSRFGGGRYEIIRRHLFSWLRGLNLAQIKGQTGNTTIRQEAEAASVITGHRRLLAYVRRSLEKQCVSPPNTWGNFFFLNPPVVCSK